MHTNTQKPAPTACHVFNAVPPGTGFQHCSQSTKQARGPRVKERFQREREGKRQKKTTTPKRAWQRVCMPSPNRSACLAQWLRGACCSMRDHRSPTHTAGITSLPATSDSITFCKRRVCTLRFEPPGHWSHATASRYSESGFLLVMYMGIHGVQRALE